MIAIISDIHGNLPALDAVFTHIASFNCTRIWCLGDTTGYGPYSSACFDLVQKRCEVVLAGNHDLAVAGDARVDPDWIPGMFQGSPGAGVTHARGTMTPDQIASLAQLQPAASLDTVDLFHASRRDPIWEYVRSPDVATAHLADQSFSLSAVGHTHTPALWELPDGTISAVGGPVQDGYATQLTPGVRRLVNPGSVGQPRDHDPRASWLMIDRGVIRWYRTPYNIEAMIHAVNAVGLPSEIGERLRHGM